MSENPEVCECGEEVDASGMCDACDVGLGIAGINAAEKRMGRELTGEEAYSVLTAVAAAVRMERKNRAAKAAKD